MRVEPALSSDREAVTALLAAVRLPLAGLDGHFPGGYVVIRDGAQLAGVAGLQPHGQFGLLRSVAVAVGSRGLGLGRALVSERLAAARAVGLRGAYLLTTDTAEWFQRLGFERVARSTVPAALLSSPQFVDACPASAACLLIRFEPSEISSS
jgi:amino-acid N-acetyltransferase